MASGQEPELVLVPASGQEAGLVKASARERELVPVPALAWEREPGLVPTLPCTRSKPGGKQLLNTAIPENMTTFSFLEYLHSKYRRLFPDIPLLSEYPVSVNLSVMKTGNII
jgi:hypothetical protein